jgi:hypothetical protein
MNAIEILFRANGIEDVRKAVAGFIGSLEQAARGSQRVTESAASAGVKAHRGAEKAKTDATKAEEAARQKELRAAQKAEETFMRAGTAARKAAERERTQESARSERDRIQALNALNRIEVREWQAKEREKTAAIESEERKRAALVQHRARVGGSVVGGAFGRVMGGAGRIAGTVAAIGGGFTLLDSIQSGINDEKTAGVILRGAENRGGFQNQKEVQQFARGAAIENGLTSADSLAGLDVFVRRTGDLQAAKEMMGDLAQLAAATGTDFADMAGNAAEVQNQLKDTKETMLTMRALAGQGRTSAIDVKDLRQYGGRLAAAASQFEGDKTQNIITAGALSQLARKYGGATDAAEATEAVARAPSDMRKHADAFKDIGVNVYADANHTKLRNEAEVIIESIVKTKGDLGKLGDLFGERSFKTVLGAQVAYTTAGGGGKGGAGENAIRKEIDDLKTVALSEDEVKKGAKERMAETDAKLNQATERFHAALNDRLLPLMPDLIDKFTRLIPAIEQALDFFLADPWRGVGIAAAGAMGLEIAKAGIPTILEGGLSAIFEGVLKSSPKGGALGQIEAALTITAAAVTIYLAGQLVLDKYFNERDKGQREEVRKVMDGENAEATLRHDASPETVKDAKEKLARLTDLKEGADKSGETSFLGEGAFGWVNKRLEEAINFTSFGNIGRSPERIAEEEAAAKNAKDVEDTMTRLQAALGKVEGAADGAAGALSKVEAPKRTQEITFGQH